MPISVAVPNTIRKNSATNLISRLNAALVSGGTPPFLRIGLIGVTLMSDIGFPLRIGWRHSLWWRPRKAALKLTVDGQVGSGCLKTPVRLRGRSAGVRAYKGGRPRRA